MKRKRLVIAIVILIIVAIAAVPYALYMSLDAYEWQGAYLVNTETGVKYLSKPELNRSEALDKLKPAGTIGRIKGDNFFGFKTWIKSIEGIGTNKMVYLQGLMYFEVLEAADNDYLPKDFGFKLSYGVGAKNVIDTYEGTFVKDLVSAGTAKTMLVFTPEEMKTIYQKMQEIDILNYPSKFAPPYADNLEPGMKRIVMPHETYSLNVTFDGSTRDIYWDDTNMSEAAKAKALRELFDYINEIIMNKDEYKKLPAFVGGYD